MGRNADGVGALTTTGLGGLLAGLMLLPSRDLGLVAQAFMFSVATPIGVLWLALMVLVHFCLRDLRDGSAEVVARAARWRLVNDRDDKPDA